MTPFSIETVFAALVLIVLALGFALLTYEGLRSARNLFEDYHWSKSISDLRKTHELRSFGS
jgi:hypothetical protein